MRAIEFLSRVEPVLQAYFSAMCEADAASERERQYLEPAYRHHSNEFYRWSNAEEIEEQRLNYMYARAQEAREALLFLDTAASAAAGAVLQSARQCLAMQWPDESRLTKGRLIGSQPISKVIWHARNQSQHFEEGLPKNNKTRDCLQTLSADAGIDISILDATLRSLAREIVRLLGWGSYEQFAQDLSSLLSEA